MSFFGWPNGPATKRQYWLIQKLAIETRRHVPPALTEGQASRYIDQLMQIKQEREQA